MFEQFRTARRLAVAGFAAVALLGACSDDDHTRDVDPRDVEIRAVDFSFQNLPEQVQPGTHLRLRNDAPHEVHEAVVFRVPDDKAATSLADLLAAAETDPMALGEFVGVSVALPGENGQEPEGPVVLERPGRYVVVCFVPTGSDPDVYRAALETGTPPAVTDGIPHLAHGMVGELRVG